MLGDLPSNLSQTKPNVPASNNAKKTAILVALINSACPVNAKLVMKMDIVNPMPPSKPAPTTCFQFMSEGSLQIPIATAKNTNKEMPKGLPITKPAKIPKLFEVFRSSVQLAPIKIPALANAKTGRIKKATGLLKKNSSLCEGELSSSCWLE